MQKGKKSIYSVNISFAGNAHFLCSFSGMYPLDTYRVMDDT